MMKFEIEAERIDAFTMRLVSIDGELVEGELTDEAEMSGYLMGTFRGWLDERGDITKRKRAGREY